MAFINDIINKIRNAMYGGDVRSSIADGIESISESQNDLQNTFEQLIINAGNSNAELAASRYDGTTNQAFETVPKRLDTMSKNISDKADLAYVDLMLANAISGGPDGIYNTLADLKNKLPNGAKGYFYVIETNHLYVWNGTAWQDAGPYNGPEVGDKSITIQKTSFIRQSENRFNKNDMLYGQYYDDQGNLVTNSAFNSPKPILVKGGTTYIVNLTEFLDVNFRDSKMMHVSGVDAGTWNGTLTIPTEASYVTFAIRNTVNLDFVMMVEGTTLPAFYIPYINRLEDDIYLSSEVENTLVQKSDLVIRKSRNLFDKNSLRYGYEVYADGSIRAQSQSATINEIDVFGKSNLYISGLTPYSTGIDCQGFFYDNFGKPIGTVIRISKSLKEISIPIPAGAYTFVTSIYQRKTSGEVVNLDTIQIEFGTAKTTYTPFDERITTIDNTPVDLSDQVKTEYILEADIGKSPLKNLFDNSQIVLGYEVYADGTLKAEANSAATKPIDIFGKKELTISGLPTYSEGYARRQSQFYNQNNVPLGSMFYIDKSLTEYYTKVPNGAHYLAITLYQRKTSTEELNLDKIQIEEGSVATEYETKTFGIDTIKGMKINGTDKPPSEILKTEDKDVLIIGDSITETRSISEDGTTIVEGTRSNWPYFSKMNLRLRNVWNFAKSGASYKDQNIVGDRRKSISEQINMAIAQGLIPQIIISAAGTNDGITNLGSYETAMAKTTLESLDRTNTYEAIRWAFWTLRNQYPDATCYAVTPLQRYDREPLTELSGAIKKMANRYNFIVIDAEYESGITRENTTHYMSDGLHPNVDGQKRQSKCIDAKILSTYNPI